MCDIKLDVHAYIYVNITVQKAVNPAIWQHKLFHPQFEFQRSEGSNRMHLRSLLTVYQSGDDVCGIPLHTLQGWLYLCPHFGGGIGQWLHNTRLLSDKIIRRFDFPDKMNKRRQVSAPHQCAKRADRFFANHLLLSIMTDILRLIIQFTTTNRGVKFANDRFYILNHLRWHDKP